MKKKPATETFIKLGELLSYRDYLNEKNWYGKYKHDFKRQLDMPEINTALNAIQLGENMFTLGFKNGMRKYLDLA